jgi:glycosyltransferase involved in cell wall biosynthesis
MVKENVKNNPKIAILHDWITGYGGGERVAFSLMKAFPDADFYTSVYEKGSSFPEFEQIKIKTTFLQKFPKKLRSMHQLFPFLRYLAFRFINLKKYDIIIMSTGSGIKKLRRTKKSKLICYCFTPPHYYWTHVDKYKKDPGFGKLNFLIKAIYNPMVYIMKKLDFKAAQSVDYFIPISTEVEKRILKYYHQKSKTIIFPPVNTSKFKLNSKSKKGYVFLGRQIKFKNPHLALQACINLGLDLTLIGDGVEHQNLKEQLKNSSTKSNITFIKNPPDSKIQELLPNFKGMIFPNEDDFGITAVEAMSTGVPVIAFKAGGALDTVKDGLSGVFFQKESVESLQKVLSKFDHTDYKKFKPESVKLWADQFSEENFINNIKKFVLSIQV